MLRLLAALLLILSAWCIGQEKHARLRHRASRLFRLLDGLLCMEGEIRAYLAPLSSALSAAGRYDPLFENAARLSRKEDGTAAFLQALQKEGLDRAEKEVLAAFANGLSAADEAGQLQNLAACRVRLSAIAETAQADAKRLGRLYSGGGAMAGLLLVILLL